MESNTTERLKLHEWSKALEPGTYTIVGKIESMYDMMLSYMYCCRKRETDPIRRPWLTLATDTGEKIQISVMEVSVKDQSGYYHRLGGKVRRAAPEKCENGVEEQWFKGEYDFRTGQGIVIVGTEPMFSEGGKPDKKN